MNIQSIEGRYAKNRITSTGLFGSILFFSLTSIVFFLSFYVVLPVIIPNYNWFQIFNIVLVLPMALLLIAAMIAVKLENKSYTLHDIKKRFRLNTMGWYDWIWTIALSIFMFGGSFAMPISFVLVIVCALIKRETHNSHRLLQGIGITIFFVISWAIPQFQAELSSMPLYEKPAYVTQFFAQIGPNSFMGIALEGRWWILIYYLIVLLLFNIGGEELWWRGYLFPKQLLALGKITWLIHGILWACFHLFFQWTAFDLVRMLPTCCALSYVAQHTKNTWPGIIGHTAGNSGILIQIARGVAGVN